LLQGVVRSNTQPHEVPVANNRRITHGAPDRRSPDLARPPGGVPFAPGSGSWSAFRNPGHRLHYSASCPNWCAEGA
jgi:hypothetical protein